jgi:7,8-dihydropterin-6-yl-methyl-4-(beta-D-ribofuranosyl)aminobenzene 5'-phosphate synthase
MFNRLQHAKNAAYGSSLPSSFYRKDETLPPEMRYYSGVPPQVMKFGAAWRGANFELIDKTTEIAPGMTLIALVSDAVGTKELKELLLAINTPEGRGLGRRLFASRPKRTR